MRQQPSRLIVVLDDGDCTTWAEDAFVLSVNEMEHRDLINDGKIARRLCDVRGEHVSNLLQEICRLEGMLALAERERDGYKAGSEAEARAGDEARAALETAENLLDETAYAVVDQERARIVAWLRMEASKAFERSEIAKVQTRHEWHKSQGIALRRKADAIERGDHRKDDK